MYENHCGVLGAALSRMLEKQFFHRKENPMHKTDIKTATLLKIITKIV